MVVAMICVVCLTKLLNSISVPANHSIKSDEITKYICFNNNAIHTPSKPTDTNTDDIIIAIDRLKYISTLTNVNNVNNTRNE